MESSWCFRGLAATAIAIAIAASSAPAYADRDGDRTTARRLAEEGDDALSQGKYAVALDAYAKAYVVVPAPTLKLAIGNVEYEQHHLIEAQRAYLEAARSPVRADDPPSWISARSEAQQKSDAITPRLPMLSFATIGLASGSFVHVRVDDADLASADVPRAVNPGRHTIVASANGYLPTSVIVMVQEGERRAVELHLTPMPTATGPRRTDAAPVAIDQRSRVPWRPLAIGGAIATGVFTGVGLATGALSNQKVSELTTKYCVAGHCENSAAARDDRDAAKRLGNAATASFVLAGASAVFTGFTLYENHKAREDASLAALRIRITTQEVHLMGQF